MATRGGEEPDYRFSLANERTFLAWIRTALALLAGGVVFEQFATKLGPRSALVAIATALAREQGRAPDHSAVGSEGQHAACQLPPAQRSERSDRRGAEQQDRTEKNDQPLMMIHQAGAQREQCVGKQRHACAVPL